MSKSKNYEKSEVSELKQTIRNLKAIVSTRDKKIKRLISDICTMQKALDESVVYIDERLASIPVEDIVSYFKDKNGKSKKSIDEVEDFYETAQDRMRLKWTCKVCKRGHLKLIIINRHDGQYYFRSCIDKDCKNRTKMKKYTEDVEGVTE